MEPTCPQTNPSPETARKIDLRRDHRIALLLASLVTALALLPQETRAQAFGYSGGAVAFPGITDITGIGSNLVSGDDTAAVAALGGPGFNFFGTTYNSLVAATNGYLSTDLTDTGPDLSNDATLPTIPSTGGGGRIYVLHDDLVVSGGIYHHYFASSPYANPTGSATSANVFQWHNTTHFGGGGPFDFQAVLFDDGNMLFLYGPGNPELGSGSTTGVQDPTFTDGYLFASNTGGSIPENFALRIQNPDAAPLPPSPPPGKPAPKPKPVVLTDAAAIISTLGTGLQMPRITRAAALGAAKAPLRDLNDRLFRARSNAPRSGLPGREARASNSVGYMQFADTVGMDMRVALGMADEESHAVDSSDTLADQDESLWLSSPVAMLGGPISLSSRVRNTEARVGGPSPQVSGKSLAALDKVVIDPAYYNRFEAFSAFDYGYYDQDNLTAAIPGFETNSYSGTIGVEYRLSSHLLVGAAFSHVRSDSESTLGLGSVDVEGHLATVYATALLGDAYLDVLYSRGDYDNEIVRNNLFGAMPRGETDSLTHHLSVNGGQNFALTEQVSTGWFGGLDYSKANIDGYSETGGGTTDLIYPDDSIESLVTRLGVHLTKRRPTAFGAITSQARVGWGHEHMPDSGTVSATLATSPFILTNGTTARRIGGLTAVGPGAHVGTDWLELGAGIRVDFLESWNVRLDYEGQFGRNNADAHLGTVKLGYEW